MHANLNSKEFHTVIKPNFIAAKAKVNWFREKICRSSSTHIITSHNSIKNPSVLLPTIKIELFL